jgi:hypothetical protein
MLGDFMQLGAMERGLGRVSLIMQPNPSWYDECFAGRRIFWRGLTHVVMLRKTHRFRDDIMPRFLAYMRDPRGRPMPADLRRVLAEWEVLDAKPSEGARDKVREWRERCSNGDPVLDEDGVTVGRRPWHAYDMGVAWQAVQRLLHYRAVRDARQAGQLLLYAQAVETCTSQPLSHAEYRRALQVVNMNTTGKLLGYCPLYKGMRVRLTAKLSGKYNVVHDAVGTVIDIWLHERDKQAETDWQDPEHEVRHRGIAQLRALPLGVLVKFDDLEEDPLGLGKGVVLVEPHVSYWKYTTHENLTGKRKQADVSMARRQIPLAPEPVRTVQTAQGMSMDAAMIFMGKPGNMNADDYWMHLYVMISRVRRSAGLLAFDMPALSVFERGPPPWVVEGSEQLEAESLKTLAEIRRAREKLGWDPEEPCSEGVVSVASRAGSEEQGSERFSDISNQVAFAHMGLPDHDGEVDDGDGDLKVLNALGRLESGLRAGSVRGFGCFQNALIRRCPDVALASGQELLREASLAQLEQLGLSDRLASLAMTTRPCSGFPNPTHDACFLTAPLQMFLRLEPVAEALRQHVLSHGAAGGSLKQGKCLDCDLSVVARALRSGGVPDVNPLVAAVQAGVLGKKPAKVGAEQDRSAPGDALAVLFGSLSVRGVIQHSGLVDSLDARLGCSAGGGVSSRGKSSASSCDPRALSLFRDVLFGAVLRERAFCTACNRATDVLKGRCFISVKVGAKVSASPARLEDLLEAWGNVGGTGPKCARGCVNSRCDVAQSLEKEPPALAIVLNRLEGGKKRRSPVRFPEELTCMRSGRYALASVLLHQGDVAQDGHFVAICAQGAGNYVECDDSDLHDLTWDQVATLKTWQDAYVLIYIRRVAMLSRAAPAVVRAPVRHNGASSVLCRPAGSVSLSTDAPNVEECSLPHFPRMSEEDSAKARQLKAAAAERRRAEGHRRGIGDLRGARKPSNRLALEAVAAMQRERSARVSRARAIQGLRDQYGAKRVDRYLQDIGRDAGDVNLDVLEGVLAADLARSVEEEVDQELSRGAGQLPRPTRWQALLESLPDVVREGLLMVLRAEYKGRCAAILSSEWSWNWVGWDTRQPNGSSNPSDGDGLYQVLASHQQHEEGELATPLLFAIHDVVRRHIRLAHANAAVEHLTDKQKEAALHRQGLKVGLGKVWGENNCLPDSLLQLLQENKIVARCVERDRATACAALRAELTNLPADSPLRPRQRDAVNSSDLGLDDSAFLQSNVHGEYILKFFLRYFGERRKVLRQLPSAGVRISVCSRFDSEVLPNESTDVCQAEVADVEEEPLDFKLFNRTGDGVSGYHYDPIMVISAEGASSSSRSSPPSLQEVPPRQQLRRSKRKSSA